MHTLAKLFSLATLASTLIAAPATLAQQGPPQDRGGRGNFDPEQMRARMIERYREQLEITSDDEWKVIEARVNKVMEARRNSMTGRGGMGFMAPRGGNDGQQNRGGNRGNRGFGGSSPEAEDLQAALEAKASSDEIKTKLAKLRDAKKAQQAALAKAQDDLRQVLSVRQEAAAVLMGLLD